MTIRFSSAARSYTMRHGSVAEMMQGCRVKLYTNAQPSSADAAPVGTLLCTITDNSGANTAEVVPYGTVTLTGGSSGSVSSITVNGVEVLGATVNFNTTLTQTAADIAAQINRWRSSPNYRASSSGAVVTISAMQGVGAGANTYAVVTTIATMTKTDVDFAHGVNSVNGLKWGDVLAGALSLLSSQTKSGVNAASGTVGWFRIESAQADSGLLDSTESQLRIDGSVGTSGADMNLNSVGFAAGATTTLPSGSLTLPAQ